MLTQFFADVLSLTSACSGTKFVTSSLIKCRHTPMVCFRIVYYIASQSTQCAVCSSIMVIINKRKIEKNIISYDFPLKFYPERILGVFLQPQLLLLQIFLEILPRITLLTLHNLFRRSGCNHRSTAFTAFRSDINDIIGGFDDI